MGLGSSSRPLPAHPPIDTMPRFACSLLRVAACSIALIGAVLLPPVTSFRPAAAQDDFADQLPRIEPLDPAEALKTFKLLPGFRMELAAAEPDVVDPVAICFDERGRMFVVEMRGYSEDKDKKISRIRLLEDTDNDGRFERSTVFAEGLLWPTALFYVNDGLLVADAPDIYFFKDTDGDGRADERKVLFTGFGISNVQGLLNSFQWSLDNRIVGVTSSSGGMVQGTASGRPGEPVNLRGRDFAIDPRDMSLEPRTGGGQHGATFDDWGDRFVCSNSDHLQQIVFEERYLARNPYLAVPGARVSIAADGPQADVFRTSPVEPWRELRTRLRVSGKVPGPVERGGLASGYFTSATGVTAYRGNAWPKEYLGQVFVADVGSNLIHRKKLVDTGILYRGERIDQKSEFLTSTDNWFRPVQMANGPDGCLYVCDMYREVIEHPNSLPPEIKKHLDLSTRGRGRIWRIVPDNFQRPEPPRLHDATTEELVATLGHENGWHRDTAARLLYTRGKDDLKEPLEKLLTGASDPRTKIHAIAALTGMKIDSPLAFAETKPQLLLAATQDPDPRVRQHAVRALEPYLSLVPRADARRALFALASDADPRVRFQVALSLGEAPDSLDRAKALAKLIESDPQNAQLRFAILSSLKHGAADLFAILVESKTLADTPAREAWLKALITQLDRQSAQMAADRKKFLDTIETLTLQADQNADAAAVVALTIENVSRGTSETIRKATDGKSHDLLRQAVAQALLAASDRDLPAEKRIAAIPRLRFGTFDEVEGPLTELLTPAEATDVQVAALSTLAAFDSPKVPPAIVARFSTFGPTLKASAADMLCVSNAGALAILDALEARQIAAADLSPAHWKLLTEHRDASLRNRAEKLYSAVRPAERSSVVEEYRASLQLTGDAARGKAVFAKQCASCHKVDGVGHELGPSLAAMKQRGREAILVNVLDPNREVNPQFVSYAVQTTDGRALSGMIAGETATSVTLKRAENATDTILRIDIEQMKSTGQSLMPEGLEKQLDKQALADLIEYLMTAQ